MAVELGKDKNFKIKHGLTVSGSGDNAETNGGYVLHTSSSIVSIGKKTPENHTDLKTLTVVGSISSSGETFLEDDINLAGGKQIKWNSAQQVIQGGNSYMTITSNNGNINLNAGGHLYSNAENFILTDGIHSTHKIQLTGEISASSTASLGYIRIKDDNSDVDNWSEISHYNGGLYVHNSISTNDVLHGCKPCGEDLADEIEKECLYSLGFISEEKKS